MAITTRAGKGSELSYTELDTNFTDLRDGVNMMVPKTQNAGIKTDSLGTPSYPWHDLLGHLQVYGDVGDASRVTYRDTVKALEFNVDDQAYIDFHMPHDYAMGTDLFFHVHWSHDSINVNGGSVTWGLEYIYAKGHDQAAFPASKTITVLQNASTTQYQHMIAETPLSIAGGSATLTDTALFEPDGLILCRLFLDSNSMTVSAGGVPDPFVHGCDVHYQSNEVGTKQRNVDSGDFWT